MYDQSCLLLRPDDARAGAQPNGTLVTTHVY